MSGGRLIRSFVVAGLLTTLLPGCNRLGFPLRPAPAPDAQPAAPAAVEERAPAASPAPARPVTAAPLRPDDLWRRIAVELRMGADGSPGVEEAFAWFTRNADYLASAAARAEPYLYFVFHEIARRGLPVEIALIPIVESGYAPRATSPDGATGLWQIMSATGRRLGLQQTRWYDGRRDVVESTRAALDYLESLRDRFRGDWLLAFAAYNCGERTVERAIERNRREDRPTDFHALDLPEETERYVPRLLALAEIFAHPEAHGVALEPIPNRAHFATVDVGAPLDLSRVVAWTSMSADEFDALNPGFRTRFTVEGTPTRVLVRLDDRKTVEQALASLSDADRRSPRGYTVAQGETLSHIAAKAGVTVAALRRANDLRSTRIRAGQQLLIPTPGTDEGSFGIVERTGSDTGVHVIVAGDTLWDLARLYGTSAGQLAAMNGIAPGATLRVGRELRVPGAAGAPANAIHYEVRKGDSLWTISRRFKVSVEELRRWNGLSKKRLLQPGQKLVVHRPDGDDGQQEI